MIVNFQNLFYILNNKTFSFIKFGFYNFHSFYSQNTGGNNMVKMTVRKKLITVTLLLLAIPSLIIGFIGYETAKTNLEEQGKISLKNNVNMALEMIESLNEEVTNGHITIEEAQERFKVAILGEKQADGTRPINQNIDMGKYGYFIVFDKAGKTVAHPTKEGEVMLDVKDSNGILFVQEQITQGNNGGGFITYNFGLPNNPNKVEPKITYTAKDPYWGWYISAGTYLVDFNSSANKILSTLFISLGIALVLGAIIIYYFANSFSKPIIEIAKNAEKIAEKDLSIKIINVKNKDEIGELAKSFNHMVSSLRAMIQNIDEASQQVASTSEELMASSEQTGQATELITESIQQIAVGSESSLKGTIEATEVVSEISKGMDQIAQSIQEVSDASF